MKMPKPDPGILSRRSEIISAMLDILSPDCVIDSAEELRAFECDALTAYRQIPLVAVLPETKEQVCQILRTCAQLGVNVVPRGAGTSLSGGALPLADGVLLSMNKFNSIVDIDFDNRCVTAGPGVTNQAITGAVEHKGFYYAPDPSSRIACSIGGNVAENAGGMHCLKYGLTTNNILGLEFILMNGEMVRLGGKHLDAGGYDLLGLMTGSEGLLGVITEVTVRILRSPETARVMLIGFPSAEAAGACVASVISAGIIPAAMEMMDHPAINAAEAFVESGYPRDAQALLIVELDGPEVEVSQLMGVVSDMAHAQGALSIKVSQNEAERQQMWQGRMSALPSVGRLSPDYFCMDGTIPRHKLPEILSRIKKLSQHYGLDVANVFHAGDGNLHPLILYDANKPGELEKVEEFGAEILKACVDVGGVLTGEHGVGIEKRDLMEQMFSETDLRVQQRVKCAFDPESRLNPGKVFPELHRCAELGRVHVNSAKGHRFPELPRF
jgi:glycolate oxidase